jgi:hypothetical protein
MPNTNKQAAIDIPDTDQTKQPCQTALLPPPNSQLAQIHSALSTASTLLATQANLAATLALAASPATLATRTQATQATIQQ